MVGDYNPDGMVRSVSAGHGYAIMKDTPLSAMYGEGAKAGYQRPMQPELAALSRYMKNDNDPELRQNYRKDTVNSSYNRSADSILADHCRSCH